MDANGGYTQLKDGKKKSARKPSVELMDDSANPKKFKMGGRDDESLNTLTTNDLGGTLTTGDSMFQSIATTGTPRVHL